MIRSHKIFKTILIGAVSLFILTSIATIILINSVNPNKYKPLIIASVNDSTGRKLSLEGNISWEIWPNIGLEITQVGLSNPEGFESGNFFELQSARVSLNILPLLRNRIVINDLSIKGLKLNLIEKNKKNNWTFTPVNETKNTKESSAVHFVLHSFSLANANITYHNSDNKTLKEIKDLNFNLDTPSDGGIRYKSDTRQLNLEDVNFSLNKNLKGTIQLDLHNEDRLMYTGNIKLDQFSLNKLLANLNQKPINIKNKSILDNISFNSDFDGSDKSINLSNLNLNVGSSTILGNVKVNNFEPLAIQNDVSINQLEASDWIDTKGYQIPMQDITIRGKINNADEGLTTMTTDQHLTIKDIMLYGMSIQHQINYAEKTLTISQFDNPVKLFERLNAILSSASPAKKDLKQQTNLGKLDTNIELKNGILTTPGFSLNGPTIKMTNHGYINFNKNYINYYTYSRIVSLPANSLLGSLTYPYIIQGNLNNPDTSLDKASLQEQIINYYSQMGKISGVVYKVKQGTSHLWNKLFH